MGAVRDNETKNSNVRFEGISRHIGKFTCIHSIERSCRLEKYLKYDRD